MKHYLHEVNDVFAEVKSSERGLTSAEAEKRLQENGKNKLAEAKKASMLSRFIDQLKTPDCVCLKVNEVAGLSNYSYSHLCKLFRKHTGETLLEYFKDLKLSYARQLLEVTDYPCREICELVGYQSSGHFIKEFTRKFQKTPSEWRAAHSPHISDL